MRRKIISVFVFSIITVACFPQYMLCQNFLIKGNISTSREPVSKAEITFINTDDNSKKFTALTDTLGNYQLSIITSVKKEEASIPTKFELAAELWGLTKQELKDIKDSLEELS